MGNWKLHLQRRSETLPYFHARGHFSYAKYAHLYLQDMQDSESTMGAEEYEKSTTQGNLTIQRTFKFWSGTWSDMTIEQSLIKNMKTFGASLMALVSVIVYWLYGRRE
ncbi:hypothetical protein AVEN_107188-1 [Araneus ventricosus]|uniref:Uncharacterized protein n=1 Tax=Araneus ventricosus TaxID=182803 RepID=A0A4Y2PCG8_ARAVE|nr:hypothetical protein AVEN_107188-1 [Araneus ventricosus]